MSVQKRQFLLQIAIGCCFVSLVGLLFFPILQRSWFIQITLICSIIYAFLILKDTGRIIRKKTLDNIYCFVILIYILACAAPFIALVERTFNNSVATIYYFWGNLLYNCIGATIAAVILLVVHRNTLDQVPDRVFIIGELVATPLSLFISLLYQLIEQSSAVVDHDPSLVTNINQNANILFLAVVFHILISGGIIAVYQIMKRIRTKVFFIAVLSNTFLYACAFNEQRYIRLLFCIGVPLVLICYISIAFWGKWVIYSKCHELGFIFVNVGLYLVIIVNGVQDIVVEPSKVRIMSIGCVFMIGVGTLLLHLAKEDSDESPLIINKILKKEDCTMNHTINEHIKKMEEIVEEEVTFEQQYERISAYYGRLQKIERDTIYNQLSFFRYEKTTANFNENINIINVVITAVNASFALIVSNSNGTSEMTRIFIYIIFGLVLFSCIINMIQAGFTLRDSRNTSKLLLVVSIIQTIRKNQLSVENNRTHE